MEDGGEVKGQGGLHGAVSERVRCMRAVESMLKSRKAVGIRRKGPETGRGTSVGDAGEQGKGRT